MRQYDNVLPIWGVQRERELDEWLSYSTNPPEMTPQIEKLIEADRKDLSSEFCRGCGYCMPCPQGIEINQCARMVQMIRRAPTEGQLSQESQKMMMKIKDCVKCGRCMTKCPFSLPIPALLEKNLRDYEDILSGRTKVNTTDARI